jgi:type IV pilus assembly protein PilW
MKLTHLHSSTLKSISNRGFTLVELMIAVAIAAIVMGALGTAYVSQRRTATAQEQVGEMQQNIRAGLDIMMHDIRMAGFNAGQNTGATITTANATQLVFTMLVADNNTDGIDNDNDGVPDEGDEVETFGYDIADTVPTNDDYTALRRQHKRPMAGAVFAAVAENIDAIEFYYTLADGTQTTTPTAAQLPDIRAVQVSILARADKPDQDFFNNNTYIPASGNAAWDINNAFAGSAGIGNPPMDNFRRLLLITTIQCRNMGL